MSTALYGLKNFVSGSMHTGIGPSRKQIDAVMECSLHANPELLAFACACEPNALDGRDAEYANRQFMGILGADYSLSGLQQDLAANRPLGGAGEFMLLSNSRK